MQRFVSQKRKCYKDRLNRVHCMRKPTEWGKAMLEQGLVQVYTGKGEQVNLAHLGLCLRAAGQGLRTCVLRLSAHPFIGIEDKALSYLKPFVVVEGLSLLRGSPSGPLKEDTRKIQAGFEHIQEVAEGGGFDIIILEEANQMLHRGIIPVDSMAELIRNKPSSVEFVLTGRNAPEEIIEQADLVTEMVEHKREEGSWTIDGTNQEGCTGVITGDGKGKTTYCLGRAMLFAASGLPASILQFIKSPQPYGEVLAIERFPNLEIKTMGAGFILGPSKPSMEHVEAARHAWEASLKEIFSLKDRLVVLDEINIATHLGLVHPDRVREMMFLKPKDLHLILSGRNAHPEMKKHAAAVFEMREIKHPFHKGIKARRGIEY
jgi:cob(I)alamin adenosyltransferase